MRTGLRISSLVPSGLIVESVNDSLDSVILTVRSATGAARCPLCGSASRRIHSRYTRQVADLPSAGRRVRLLVITRRFACEVSHCRRRIFAERFGGTLPVRARRTARLECIVHYLGLALGGRPNRNRRKRKSATSAIDGTAARSLSWPQFAKKDSATAASKLSWRRASRAYR
jgi:transposase